jgi:hypothetical protein
MVMTQRRLGALAFVTAAAVFAFVPAALADSQAPEFPVMVGGLADMDACWANGTVSGIESASGGYAAVRSGPADSYAELEMIGDGIAVTLCDRSGEWIGIVYHPYDRVGDVDGYEGCGVASPIAEEQNYTGTCRSGWVHESFVIPLAGSGDVPDHRTWDPAA